MRNKNTAGRLACLLLSASLLIPFLSSCNAEPQKVDEQPQKKQSVTVGYSSLPNKLNPFFVTTESEQAVMGLTQVRLLTLDRVGDVIKNGIAGETRSYAGVDYFYSGISDISLFVSEETGVAEYTVTLRDGLKFSDGQNVTADDIIFSMYVLCDPEYDGNSKIRYSPISGLDNYLTQTDSESFAALEEKFNLIHEAGADHIVTKKDPWTEEEQEIYAASIVSEWKEDLRAITDFCVSEFAEQYGMDLLGIPGEEIVKNEEYHVAFAMAAWGFASLDSSGKFVTVIGSTYTLTDGDLPDIDAFYDEVYTVYDGDHEAYWDDANGGEVDTDNVIDAARLAFISELGSGNVPSISGITKIDDRTVKITADSYHASDIYDIFDLYVAPLHYYGNEAEFDVSKNKFGFIRGELDEIENNTHPLGAGAYIFESNENGKITLSVNNFYYKALPSTEKIELISLSGTDPLEALSNSTVDIVTSGTDSSILDRIRLLNSGGQLSGDTVITSAADVAAYGYIGINANTVLVGDDPDSNESIYLRRALATIFSAYREAAVYGYYGEAARVINYPMSEASYIAPDRTDSDYTEAFSVDVDGKKIYSSDMNVLERYDAALSASIEYFIAAGYVYDSELGVFTAAPDGASLEFDVIVPAGGNGDHPCYPIFKKAADILDTVGITLSITDPVSSSLLWGKLRAGSQQIWAAARTVEPEPDMTDFYASQSTPDLGGSNYYRIRDDILDFYMSAAKISPDRAFRQVSYREALSLIEEWAIEIPIYQKQNFTLFSAERIDGTTVPAGLTAYHPWYLEAENISVK